MTYDPASSRSSGGSGSGWTGPDLPSARYSFLSMPNNGNFAMTKDREYCLGFILGAQTISKLGVVVKVAGDASAVVRIGIRADNNGTPGAAAIDTTVVATSTGWKEVTVSYAHPGGILWVTVTGQGWSATAVSIDSAQGYGNVPIVGAASLPTFGWAAGHTPQTGYQAGVSGALPATFVNVNAFTLGAFMVAALLA